MYEDIAVLLEGEIFPIRVNPLTLLDEANGSRSTMYGVAVMMVPCLIVLLGAVFGGPPVLKGGAGIGRYVIFRRRAAADNL